MGLQVIPNMAITGARDQCRAIAGTLATIRIEDYDSFIVILFHSFFYILMNNLLDVFRLPLYLPDTITSHLCCPLCSRKLAYTKTKYL
jgi:uncharacterized membrane protein